jgi:hypothetical protein
MTRIIEIENGLARIVDRTIVSEQAMADVLPLLETRIPVSMFHPSTARFTYWDESNVTKRVRFLCELPPAIRYIRKLNRKFRLAMPWTYFVLSYETVGDPFGIDWTPEDHRIFHSPTKVTSMNNRLWTAFLPNVYNDGRICFGTTGVPTHQPLADRVDQLVSQWYLTEFNNDVIGTRNHPLPFNGRHPYGYRLWVEATAEHGLDAMTRFPEWQVTNGNDVNSFLVSELLAAPGLRTDPITVTGGIPEIPFPATWGRLAQTLTGHSFTNQNRHQMLSVLQGLQEETPDLFEAPPPPPVIEPGAEDDGSEPY